jgi:hypothetical protein
MRINNTHIPARQYKRIVMRVYTHGDFKMIELYKMLPNGSHKLLGALEYAAELITIPATPGGTWYYLR